MSCSALSITQRLARFLERLNGVRLERQPVPAGADRATLEFRDGHGRAFRLEVTRNA